MSIEFDIKNDIALLELLSNADHQDLDALVDVLTDAGNGRVALSKSSKVAMSEAKSSKLYDEDIIKLIISELQHFGGNSLVNLARGDGVDYREVVADVASYLGVRVTPHESVVTMEGKILAQLFAKTWQEMGPAERERHSADARGFNADGTYNFALLKALMMNGGTVSSLQGLFFAPQFLKMLVSGAFAGRFLAGGLAGIAGMVGWVAYKATGEALRVTIPCVALIGIIRHKQLVTS
ncbi:hypothetical protein ACIOMR_28160 [Pseudomonas sp. NPDC087814]|uniref:hypothetical protein n=1 Tax=Pseudomonas sp. NPDC087814 TaxID=3364450 RepID=UPI00381A1B7F